MIRVVADTNVLASGLAGYGHGTSPATRVLEAWQRDQVELVTSAPLLSELRRTLSRPFFARRLSRCEIDQAFDLLRRRSHFVDVLEEVRGIATTPEDDLIVATAVSSQEKYFVTGDRQLRIVGRHRGIEFLVPREFIDLLGTGERL